VEWIRFLLFFRQDFPAKLKADFQLDCWPWLNRLRCSSKFNGVKIFFAFGEKTFGPRPLYPDDPVDPVIFLFKDKNPFLFFK